jgi:hypothetical protein
VAELLIIAFVMGWSGGFSFYWGLDHLDSHSHRVETNDRIEAVDIGNVVEQIIKAESDGDPNPKNKRSGATGLGQFLDETWLRLIRTHRPGDGGELRDGCGKKGAIHVANRCSSA